MTSKGTARKDVGVACGDAVGGSERDSEIFFLNTEAVAFPNTATIAKTIELVPGWAWLQAVLH
jgi:hypothetical protein